MKNQMPYAFIISIFLLIRLFLNLKSLFWIYFMFIIELSTPFIYSSFKDELALFFTQHLSLSFGKKLFFLMLLRPTYVWFLLLSTVFWYLFWVFYYTLKSWKLFSYYLWLVMWHTSVAIRIRSWLMFLSVIGGFLTIECYL